MLVHSLSMMKMFTEIHISKCWKISSSQSSAVSQMYPNGALPHWQKNVRILLNFKSSGVCGLDAAVLKTLLLPSPIAHLTRSKRTSCSGVLSKNLSTNRTMNHLQAAILRVSTGSPRYVVCGYGKLYEVSKFSN